MCKDGLLSFFVCKGFEDHCIRLEANLKKNLRASRLARGPAKENRLSEQAPVPRPIGSSSAHLIVLDLGPGLVLEVPVVVGVQEVQQVQQVQQEGRLDLVPGLVLEVPVGVEVHEVQEVQQELETDVLFEL